MQDLKPLLQIKFVFYWLMMALLCVVVYLPWRVRMFLGVCLGWVFFKIKKKRLRILSVNLKKVLPELSEKEHAALCKECMDNVGRGVIETGMAWFFSEKRLRKISRFECDEKSLSKLQDPNQAVVLLGSHSTLLELGVRLLGIYVDSAGLYRPLDNAFYDAWIRFQRGRAATGLVSARDMRAVLRVLDKGENIWYALDQDMGRKSSVFVPFFGVEAATVNVLPRLKERSNAALIPVFMWREGREYVVRVLPELKSDAGEDAEALMARVNHVYEEEIRHYITQYFWVHRRFKTRPNPEDAPWY